MQKGKNVGKYFVMYIKKKKNSSIVHFDSQLKFIEEKKKKKTFFLQVLNTKILQIFKKPRIDERNEKENKKKNITHFQNLCTSIYLFSLEFFFFCSSLTCGSPIYLTHSHSLAVFVSHCFAVQSRSIFFTAIYVINKNEK